MAGIAGILGNDNGELEQMLKKIQYRGPHETWTNRASPVNIGCLELNVGGNCKDGAHHAYDGEVAAITKQSFFTHRDEIPTLPSAKNVIKKNKCCC